MCKTDARGTKQRYDKKQKGTLLESEVCGPSLQDVVRKLSRSNTSAIDLCRQTEPTSAAVAGAIIGLKKTCKKVIIIVNLKTQSRVVPNARSCLSGDEESRMTY